MKKFILKLLGLRAKSRLGNKRAARSTVRVIPVNYMGKQVDALWVEDK